MTTSGPTGYRTKTEWVALTAEIYSLPAVEAGRAGLVSSEASAYSEWLLLPMPLPDLVYLWVSEFPPCINAILLRVYPNLLIHS